MAISKSLSMTHQYVNNASSPTAATFTVEPVVVDGALVVGFNRTRPGVFTAGTAPEATASNPNNDSNA